MKNFWQKIIRTSGGNEFYFIVNDNEYEVLSKQNIIEFLSRLDLEKIQSFALSSVIPDFLNAKEIDLALTRSLLSNHKIKFPFHLKFLRHRIVEPKDYRIRFTFSQNEKINQYECTGATINECINIWNHLIENQNCNNFIWNYENSNWGNQTEWYLNYLSIREKQEQKELAHPPLMTNVSWSFLGDTYKDKQEFATVVTNYMSNLGKHWNPNEKISAENEFIVYYSYFVDGREKTGKITAKSLTSWTSLDLLFLIHNKCVKKISNQDNHFFEGLTYYQDDNNGKPIYFMELGS